MKMLSVSRFIKLNAVAILFCSVGCADNDDGLPASVETVPVSATVTVTTLSAQNRDNTGVVTTTTPLVSEVTEPASAEPTADSSDESENQEMSNDAKPSASIATTTTQLPPTTSIPYDVQTYEPNEAPSGAITYEPSA